MMLGHNPAGVQLNVSGADTVFEMEIGTNRPDAMNHYGVAREAAAIYDFPLKPLSGGNSMTRRFSFPAVEKPERVIVTWITEFHNVEIPFRFEGLWIP